MLCTAVINSSLSLLGWVSVLVVGSCFAKKETRFANGGSMG